MSTAKKPNLNVQTTESIASEPDLTPAAPVVPAKTAEERIAELEAMIAAMTAAQKATQMQAAEPEPAGEMLYGMTLDEFRSLSVNEQEKLRAADRIEIFLMKDNNKYSQPLEVCVNGIITSIPRGQRIMVRRDVFDAIRNQDRQDMLAIEKQAEAMKNKLYAEL